MLLTDRLIPTLIKRDPFLVVLDGLQEPGNKGTILRTALATGAKGDRSYTWYC